VSNGCWKWWSWQRWVDKWMRRWIETRLVRLTKSFWKLIARRGNTNMYQVSKCQRAMCDCQWVDDWWYLSSTEIKARSYHRFTENHHLMANNKWYWLAVTDKHVCKAFQTLRPGVAFNYSKGKGKK